MESMNNIDASSHYFNNKDVTKKQWTAFYENIMRYSARNQRGLSNIESGRCDLCNEVEDAKHLLISCAYEIDVFWNSTFNNEYLGYPKSADPHLVYNSIRILKLDIYYFFYIYDMQSTIYVASSGILQLE